VIKGRSNNVEVWGRSSQPPESIGDSGDGAPDAEAILQYFSKKNNTFLSIIWSRFLLKRVFK